MTDHEKKLNKVDLHGYKNLEGQIYSIVPGVHHLNTIASVPVNRVAAQEMDMNTISAGRTSMDSFAPTVRDNNATYTRKRDEANRRQASMELERQRSEGQLFIPDLKQQNPMKRDPVIMTRNNSGLTIGEAAQKLGMTGSNPIWNPLPYYDGKLFHPKLYNPN